MSLSGPYCPPLQDPKSREWKPEIEAFLGIHRLFDSLQALQILPVHSFETFVTVRVVNVSIREKAIEKVSITKTSRGRLLIWKGGYKKKRQSRENRITYVWLPSKPDVALHKSLTLNPNSSALASNAGSAYVGVKEALYFSLWRKG